MLPLAVLLLSFSRQAFAIPSATSLQADLTFLFQNDLNWTTAADHKGTILINKFGTKEEATAACAELNESILPTDGPYFDSDMKSLLTYLNVNSRYYKQKFWVDSTPDAPCSVVSLPGSLQSVPCNSRFPTFCSQSSPYRRNTDVDPDPKFRVQVKSKKLTIVGTRDHLSFRFLGIPYADPFERFSYSKLYSGAGTINALNYGSPCTQSSGGSEDCLFLNIYTPYLPRDPARSKSLKPVMFWIHGGGFTDGQASDSIYDGGNMASRSDVVVVSINYRLGALGFLALEDGVTNGNFGIADQITALQWVREHIAEFGGDPSLVTIYGQSAGAGSVRALLASPPAFGLFQGAIAQSNLGGFGYASTYSKYLTIQQQYASFGAPLVSSVGCAGSANILQCLRALPASSITSTPNGPRYIVVDGKFITTDQLEVNGSGQAARAHVMFGWTRDDGSDFIGPYPTPGSTLAGALLAAGLSSDVVDKVVGSDLFPTPLGPNSLENLFNLTSRIGTDGQFRCIDQATVISAAKHDVFASVWAYQFDRSYGGYEPVPGTCDPPSTPAFPNGDPNLPYYRCHSGELYYMFGNLGQDSLPFRDEHDLLLSQYAVDMWGSFARTQNPNPSPYFLTARGYTNTANMLRETGRWNKVTPREKAPLRIIDNQQRNSQWLEEEQCDLLGYPFTYFG
ncbi:Para-nitrobenzyl esterase [Psilocybe cubensis]|uniref:Para-nitrobenzyl esterase n=2 Tax=Psilocybe cubensis TaxID=181762 RepID=A0ACB8GTM3_PSICU|nr:Para-nitrobenzyl esterase [Psilocybe cubensis]KAH9479073.1 Para-nitrobenzyl esterase [Psilocybe cubensis]